MEETGVGSLIWEDPNHHRATKPANSLQPHGCSLPGFSVHGFSRQEYWKFPPPGDLANPGMEPPSPAASAQVRSLWAGSLPLSHLGNPAKPVGHVSWACAREPGSRDCWARVPQGRCSASQEPIAMRGQRTAARGWPCSPKLEKSWCGNGDPTQPWISE